MIQITEHGAMIRPEGAVIGECECCTPATKCGEYEVCHCSLTEPGCAGSDNWQRRWNCTINNGQVNCTLAEYTTCCCKVEQRNIHLEVERRYDCGVCSSYCHYKAVIRGDGTYEWRWQIWGWGSESFCNYYATDSEEGETGPAILCYQPILHSHLPCSIIRATGHDPGNGHTFGDCEGGEYVRSWRNPNWAYSCGPPGSQYESGRMRAWSENYEPCFEEPCTWGACCCKGRCFNFVGPEACAAMGGTYQGDDTLCNEVECPRTCCLPDGCEMLSRSDCLDAGGIPGLGHSCDEGECRGACCDDEFGCTEVEEHECTDHWRGLFSRCSEPEICTKDLGACCGRFGSCVVTTRQACEQQSDGTYKGDGVPCSPYPCPGVVACCIRDDAFNIIGCTEELSEAECENIGGIPNPGVLCSSGVCDPDPGLPHCNACCVGEVCHDVENAAACAALGGVYGGDGVGCDGDDCAVTMICTINAAGGDDDILQSPLGGSTKLGGVL